MDQQMRAVIDAVKKELLSQVPGMRMANKAAPVSGLRQVLPLEGRDIDIVYYPARGEMAPLLIGFHGGGFLFGGCALDDGMWNAMRNELKVNIASVEYRKTPDFMWPTALEDAYDAALYLRDHASEFGFDKNRISVFGSSAGANLAATLCLYAKQKGDCFFEYQILNYPLLDLHTDPMEKGGGSLSGPILYVFNKLYIKPEDALNSLASPVFARKEELTGLPAAIIRTAGDDCLRAEGETYANMLRDAGVTVYLSNADNMPHGYYEYGFGGTEAPEYLDEPVRRMIQDGTLSKAASEGLAFIQSHYK